LSKLYERFLVKATDTSSRDPRSPVAKDRDRVVHASAFRRLQGKSQIVGVEVGDFFRTRITHSLECAQIGRAIAANVAQDEDCQAVVEDAAHLPDLVEAACLAHDLGHPPFGHNGEVTLRKKMQEHAGSLFEGNPQSFRIVTLIEPKFYGPTKLRSDELRWVGLDLTRTALRALMKYPEIESEAMLAEDHPKFGAYKDTTDAEYFDWVWGGKDPQEKTLTARIMDVADDVAYAVHDFEDGVWAGMIPLYELLAGNEHVRGLLEAKVLERDDRDGLFAKGEFAETFDAVITARGLEYLRDVGYDRTREARAELKNFTASLIGDLINAISGSGKFTEPSGDVARRIALFKGMAWQWMIQRTDIETYQYGQRRLVQRIFDGYWERPDMLPRREEWEALKKAAKSAGASPNDPPGKARLICDHIAGMTDGYARQVYDQMYRATQRRDLRLTY
jgi:dGTPase